MDKAEAVKILGQLKSFSEKNRTASTFSEPDFNAMLDIARERAWLHPVQFNSLTILRARHTQHGTDFEHVSQMSYPPESKVTTIGRCHLPRTPIFYGSNNIPTCFLEIDFTSEKPCAVVVAFSLKQDEKLTLISVGELDHFRRFGHTRIKVPGVDEMLQKHLDSLEHYDRTLQEFVDAYLSDFFRRVPSDQEKNVYEVTARISKELMAIDGVDGLIFPSVRHEGGINFALRPTAFDAKFEVTKYFLTMPVLEHGYGLFEWFEHAEGTQLAENGDFCFRTNPHFHARATWPRSADQ